MASERLQILEEILGRNPEDAFARYGLAMELVKAGDLKRAANEFAAVLERDPNYSYAYFHGAQTLEKMGRLEEAAGLYRRGIESASQRGDRKALGELQAALDMLPL